MIERKAIFYLWLLALLYNTCYYAVPSEDLLLAITRSDMRGINRALRHGADAGIQDSYGTSALALAMRHLEGPKSTLITRALINQGADLTLRDDDGNTPLHLAAQGRDPLALFNALLQPEYEMDVNVQNNRGQTPLMMLLARINQGGTSDEIANWSRAAQALIQHPLFSVNLPDTQGTTALMIAASGHAWSHGALGPSLLARGAVVNNRDSSGITPLIFAVKNDNVEAVISFIQTPGINLDIVDGTGRSALQWAQTPVNKKPCVPVIVGLLIQAGATIPDLISPLIQASEAGNLAAVQELINQGVPINSRDAAGRTALMAAAEAGQAHIVHYLLGVHDQFALSLAPRLFDESSLNQNLCYSQTLIPLLPRSEIDVTLTDNEGNSALTLATGAAIPLLANYQRSQEIITPIP